MPKHYKLNKTLTLKLIASSSYFFLKKKTTTKENTKVKSVTQKHKDKY